MHRCLESVKRVQGEKMTNECMPRVAGIGVLAVVITCAAGYAQIQDKNKPDNGTQVPGTMSSEDLSFLAQAIELNFAEVELGGLVPSRAQSPRVKSYGEMLVKDHWTALGKFQALEPGGSKTKPQLSPKHEELKMKLSELNGADFDREYIDAMVKGHRDAIAMFERQAGMKPGQTSGGKDSPTNQLNKLVRDTLPSLKRHLEQAGQIQKTLSQPVKKSTK
jgi:putative membrane protein